MVVTCGKFAVSKWLFSWCSELRTKDLERITNVLDELNARVKRGLTKEQKEDMAIAEKVKEWLESGKDIR
jgi:hypothetical protein